ncbi:unnamed protein product [Lampetra planeri]
MDDVFPVVPSDRSTYFQSGRREAQSDDGFLTVTSDVNPDAPILQQLVFSKTCPNNAVVTLQCTDCGRGVNSSRASGDQPAPLGSWPWQVSLQMSGSHRCGGAVVSPYWIVTTAHCVSASRPEDWAVYAGVVDPLGTLFNPAYPVSRVIAHEGFDPPFSEERHRFDAARQTSGQHSSAVYEGRISQDMLCAGGTTAGPPPCHAADGAALLVTLTHGKWWLVGVNVWGQRCHEQHTPAVYGNVTYFLDWMFRQMKAAESGRGSGRSAAPLAPLHGPFPLSHLMRWRTSDDSSVISPEERLRRQGRTSRSSSTRRTRAQTAIRA